MVILCRPYGFHSALAVMLSVARTIVAACIAGVMSASPLVAQRSLWWRDASIQQELGLTPGQAAAMDLSYSATLEQRTVLRRALDRAERNLHQALARGDLTDAEGAALVSQVEDLRRRRNIARTQMLLQLYRQLSSRQRILLSEKPTMSRR